MTKKKETKKETNEEWLLGVFKIPKGKARRNYMFSYESKPERGDFTTIRTDLETGLSEERTFNFFRNEITKPSKSFFDKLFKLGKEQNEFVKKYNKKYK